MISEWLATAFDTDSFEPYVAPPIQTPLGQITVSLGVGENEDKRLSTSFETYAIQTLVESGRSVLLDRGAGGEEGERVTSHREGIRQSS